MTEKAPQLNLHQKLVEVRKSIGGFTKDTKGYNYSYVSGSQVLSKIQEKMNELGVLLVPKIQSQQFEKHEYTNSKGKPALDFLVYGDMTYTWVNAENPEDILEVPFYYTGAQDDISKAFGSGLTYSERYFVIKFFNLPTDADDPDGRDTSGRSGNGGNYNNQPSSQSYSNNLPMPKNATEAGQITLSFGKHKGKTLRELFADDKDRSYLQWLVEQDKTDAVIKEAVGLMQIAVAQHNASKAAQQ